ncbi:MAG: methionyl-tRNA formyltransferase [Dehalococcoidia bacterium]
MSASPDATGARIVFIGGRAHGFQLLERLLERGERIERIFALEEDEHEPLRFDHRMEALASRAGVSCAIRKRLTRGDIEQLVALAPDMIIVLGWRTILPPSVIHASRLGCFGVHDSLLPRYRGFAPTNWSVINREAATGVTLWRLNEEVDAGEIVAQREIAIGSCDTAADIYARVTDASVALVLEHLPSIVAGTAPLVAQDDARATYACARTPEDGLIDWRQSNGEIAALVRALTRPYPGAYTYLDGRLLRVWSARALVPSPAYVGRIAGRVAKLHRGAGVEVLCGSGSLMLEEVQAEDAAPGRADELIRSVRITLGPTYQELYRRLASVEGELARLRATVERGQSMGVHA